jgi:hypothetical protein
VHGWGGIIFVSDWCGWFCWRVVWFWGFVYGWFVGFLFVFMYGVCEEFWDLCTIFFETLSNFEMIYYQKSATLGIEVLLDVNGSLIFAFLV